MGERIEQFVEQTLQEWMPLQVNRDKTRTVRLYQPGARLNFPREDYAGGRTTEDGGPRM